MSGRIGASTQQLLSRTTTTPPFPVSYRLEMMQQSGLNPIQQRQLTKAVSDGTHLPVHCNPNGRPVKRSMKMIKNTHVEQTPPRPSLRTRDQIIESGVYEIDPYRPRPKKDLLKEKERLINLMVSEGKTDKRVEEPKAVPKPIEELDEFDMIVEEIEERQAWLNDMYAVGQGAKYHNQIMSEINLRLKQLERIDKDRTQSELQSLLNLNTE